MIIKFIETNNDGNCTIKQILKNKLDISSKLLTKLKTNNCIFINNNIAMVNNIVHENDIILVNFDNIKYDKTFSDKFKPYNYVLDILYEDEYILIVNKPAFMPVHPSSQNYTTTLANAVNYYLKSKNINTIHIVTRLDKNTSGICIFAKNEYIQELFIRRKEKIQMCKEYICIANGIISNEHFVVQKNISRKEGSIITREVNENGDYAKTEFLIIDRNYEKNYTILRAILHTGRTHQIRVHLADQGNVLLGDDLYANEYKIQNISQHINRQALHCEVVSFFHPITFNKISIRTDVPYDMKILM